MRIYKDGKFLTFELDSGELYKYDLSEYKLYLYGEVINPLISKLANIKYIDCKECIENNEYKEFFKFLNKMCMNFHNYNDEIDIAFLLQILPKYSKYEQIYSAGLKVLLKQDWYSYNYGIDYEFNYSIKDIPKGLIKICKDNSIYLDNNFVKSYLNDSDGFNLIYSLKDKYKKLNKTDLKTLATGRVGYSRKRKMFMKYISEDLNCNRKKFLMYVDNLKSEKQIRKMKDFISDYYDYADINISMNNNEFEKYPKNFKQAHDDSVAEKQRRLEEEYRNKQKKLKEIRLKQSKAFKSKKYEKNHLKYDAIIDDYIFIYPHSIEAIELEGKSMHNCVATYINRVMNNACEIVFMRDKNKPNKSLLTIEIRNNEVVQSRRVCNSSPIPKDYEAIKKYEILLNQRDNDMKLDKVN